MVCLIILVNLAYPIAGLCGVVALGAGKLSLAFTNFQAPVNGPPRPNPAATNVPMCLVPKGGAQPPATTPTAPSTINGSLPLQVWAGPLAGGDVVRIPKSSP